MRTASSPQSGGLAKSHTPAHILRLRYTLFILSSLSFVAEFLLADSNQSARLGSALSFVLQPSRGGIADFFPTGRSMTWRTTTRGRPPWTKTPWREAAKPAAKLAAPGLESASTTGRTTMRLKSSHAVSRRLATARVPPLRRLLGAAGKSVVPRRVCSAVGRRSPEAGQRRLGGRRWPRRRPASARR